jgi:hypothetical protein
MFREFPKHGSEALSRARVSAGSWHVSQRSKRQRKFSEAKVIGWDVMRPRRIVPAREKLPLHATQPRFVQDSNSGAGAGGSVSRETPSPIPEILWCRWDPAVSARQDCSPRSDSMPGSLPVAAGRPVLRLVRSKSEEPGTAVPLWFSAVLERLEITSVFFGYRIVGYLENDADRQWSVAGSHDRTRLFHVVGRYLLFRSCLLCGGIRILGRL